MKGNTRTASTNSVNAAENIFVIQTLLAIIGKTGMNTVPLVNKF